MGGWCQTEFEMRASNDVLMDYDKRAQQREELDRF